MMAGFATCTLLLTQLLVGAPPASPAQQATMDTADDAVWDFLETEQGAQTEDPVSLLLLELDDLENPETE